MANIKSNDKRHSQDIKKHLLNHSQMSRLKTQIKKTQISKSNEDLNYSFELIDVSLAKGIIHKNKANRMKSRLIAFINNKKNVSNVEIKKQKTKSKEAPKIKEEAVKREQETLKVVETKKATKDNPVTIEQTSIIMISTSPKHADAILDDETKNVVFYKVTPVNSVKRVLIYATAPIKAVVGEFDLEKIDILALSTIWGKYGSSSAMSKKEFMTYYEGKKQAHAMISKESFRYSKPKKLEDFGMTKGPSGFQYLK